MSRIEERNRPRKTVKIGNIISVCRIKSREYPIEPVFGHVSGWTRNESSLPLVSTTYEFDSITKRHDSGVNVRFSDEEVWLWLSFDQISPAKLVENRCGTRCGVARRRRRISYAHEWAVAACVGERAVARTCAHVSQAGARGGQACGRSNVGGVRHV
jgi:hypothetical protein